MIPLLFVILLDPNPEVLVPPYPENFEAILGITQGSIYTWSYHDNNEMVIDAMHQSDVYMLQRAWLSLVQLMAYCVLTDCFGQGITWTDADVMPFGTFQTKPNDI